MNEKFKKSDTYLCTNSIVSLWFSFTDSAVVIGGYCSWWHYFCFHEQWALWWYTYVVLIRRDVASLLSTQILGFWVSWWQTADTRLMIFEYIVNKLEKMNIWNSCFQNPNFGYTIAFSSITSILWSVTVSATCNTFLSAEYIPMQLEFISWVLILYILWATSFLNLYLEMISSFSISDDYDM